MNCNIGYLSICCGCMFSGKTSWLMDQFKKYSYIGKKITVINYADDKRYHDSHLSTHDKKMIPCIQSHSLKNVYNEMNNAEVILINEGQFFPDLYEFVIQMVEQKGKIVHIAALDGDFKRNVFGEILQLIPRCDNYLKLHALCAKCRDGTNASFSHRISNEDKQISIGSDNYIPLCRKCYQFLNNIYSTNLAKECIEIRNA